MRCSGKLESKNLKQTSASIPPFSMVEHIERLLPATVKPSVVLASPHPVEISLSGCGQRITAGNVLQSSSKLHRVYSLAMVHVVSIQ